MAEQKLKPGDYVGLYLDNVLIYTGVLKDIGEMVSGRTIYQILLVKNIFQRNYPEIHFSDKADVRTVTYDDLKAEMSRLKANLAKNIEKMEPEHVSEIVATEEWHSIVG
jgi:hypothetical protein